MPPARSIVVEAADWIERLTCTASAGCAMPRPELVLAGPGADRRRLRSRSGALVVCSNGHRLSPAPRRPARATRRNDARRARARGRVLLDARTSRAASSSSWPELRALRTARPRDDRRPGRPHRALSLYCCALCRLVRAGDAAARLLCSFSGSSLVRLSRFSFVRRRRSSGCRMLASRLKAGRYIEARRRPRRGFLRRLICGVGSATGDDRLVLVRGDRVRRRDRPGRGLRRAGPTSCRSRAASPRPDICACGPDQARSMWPLFHQVLLAYVMRLGGDRAGRSR